MALGLRTLWQGYEPSAVIAQLGPFTLHWYGLAYVVAIVAGLFITDHTLKKLSKTGDARAVYLHRVLPTFTLGLVLAGIIGGRLYHVANEWWYYANNPWNIFALGQGGLAIHGALLAGALYLWWFSSRLTALRPYGLTAFLWLLDLLSPTVLLGQAIGRWGNYFNQELFGRPTALPWGIPIEPDRRPPDYATVEFFHPTFLYESLWDLLGFFMLYKLQQKILFGPNGLTALRPGVVAALYLVWMGLGRAGVELLRVDPVPLVLGVRLPLLVAGGIAAGGLVWVTTLSRTARI